MRSISSGSAGAASTCLVLAGFFAHFPDPAAATTFQTDFEALIFAEAPDLYAKDHSLVQHGDGVFHLFYAVGDAGQAWGLPGNETEFGHATSLDLTHWAIQPRVLVTDPAHGWKSRNVWAPHVLRADFEIAGDVWPYVMSYTGVDSARNQQIGIAVSADLFNWNDLSVDTGAFRPNRNWALWNPDSTWQNCRDSFVFRQGNELLMLTSVLTRPDYLGLGKRGAIALASSQDGLNWVDRGSPLVINDHWTLMPSSHLVQNPESGLWHLMYTRPVNPGGVHMLTSNVVDQNWDMATDTIFDSASIASEITSAGGTYIYSHVKDFITQTGLETRAVRFDNLTWSDARPLYSTDNPFWNTWTLVEGQLGAMPTYRDRPGVRSGVASNVQGLFWVNTAEDDSGPYQLGCPTCGANEAFTGVLRSPTFTVSHRTIRLWVGGTATQLAYVALVQAGGQRLRTAYGLGTDVMSMREWDTSDLVGTTAYFEIADRASNGHVSVDQIEAIGEVVGVPGTPAPPLVGGLTLSPNPSLGPAVLAYDLAREAEVSLSIYGADGRSIRRLVSGIQTAGRREIRWDGLLAGGEKAPTGVYYFRLVIRDAGGEAGTVTRLAVVR